MSQIGTLETLIGSHALYSHLATSLATSLANGAARNYVFGLPGRAVPPHVDSDKLRDELHS